MASSYPGALDSFTNPTSTDAMDASAALYHDVQHSAINDAVEAVQAELGTDPAGAQATVKARLENAESFMTGGPWVSGQYLSSMTSGNLSAGNTTVSGSADRVYYVPWWCPASVTVDRIAVQVSTLQSGANARLGIYSPTAAGGPGALLLDAGEIDCSTTGVKVLTVSQAITAGTLYWLALLNETAGVVYVAPSIARPAGSFAATTDAEAARIYQAQTYTSGLLANAAAWGSLSAADNTFPLFWLRRT